MADNLTDQIENAILDHLNGVAVLTITAPIKAKLMTTNGNDATAGTEVTGGSYAAKTVVWNSASSGQATPNADLTWTGMPACTVVGAEVWDSSATPKRIWWGALSTSKTLQAGDTFSLAAANFTQNIG